MHTCFINVNIQSDFCAPLSKLVVNAQQGRFSLSLFVELRCKVSLYKDSSYIVTGSSPLWCSGNDWGSGLLDGP